MPFRCRHCCLMLFTPLFHYFRFVALRATSDAAFHAARHATSPGEICAAPTHTHSPGAEALSAERQVRSALKNAPVTRHVATRDVSVYIDASPSHR